MNVLARLFDESKHPRDPHSGEFTETGGDSGEGEHPGEGYSKNARLIDGVIHTSNVYDAVLALYQNRKVELNQPRGVSILLDKLGKISKDMIEKGEKAPNFNLCNVTIKASSLFCADTHGIPRVQMPQLTKDQDKPFRDYLAAKGYKIEREDQYASYLRATQNELNGSKVAGIAALLRSGTYHGNANPIFVSKDDYILDGHHRWAAEIGNDAADNKLGDSNKMAIWRVNISITKLLEEAEAFTEGKGKLAVDQERRKQMLAHAEAVMRGGGLGTSAHTDFMNDCVPQLMGYGKDQITAVAACLNMWRDAWEESHPDGANDPGPSPKEADPNSPLAADAKAFNESEHPRDDHGRWTDGGGSDATVSPDTVAPTSDTTTATAHSIEGLPDDIVIKDRLIAQAQERGAWNITAKETGKEGSSGRERYELTITSKQPVKDIGILSFNARPLREGDNTEYYDPVLGELYTTDKGDRILERTYVRPREGYSRDIEPLPDKDVIYRGMRAEEFQKFLETGKIESTGSYNMAGQEGLTYWATDAATAASYANGFAPWPHKATFERPAFVVATKLPKPEDIRHVEGVGDNEVGVSRAVTKNEIVAVYRGDVFWHTPGKQDIRPTSYDPNENLYEGGGGSGVSSDVVWQRVRHDGVTDREHYEAEKKADKKTVDAMDKALIRPLAEKVATKLDFNPALIEFTDQDAEFELAGSKYKYAGSYTHGDPTVKLYTNQLNSSTAKGVVAHEIGHRKFYLLQQAYQAESKQVMEDPGPPPDPNHRYWWGKRGGPAAIMTPDGELREPYDKKYPVYHEWAQIQNMRPSLERDDGITPYSTTYWKEWEKGKMDTGKAYHETMAEMSRNFGVMGKHSAVTGKGWRRLYDLQEKVWAETDKTTRDAKTTGPVKALFILNGVRWEVR